MFHKSYSGELAIAARQSVKEREYWMDNLSGELEKSIFPYDNKELDYKEGDKDHVDVQLREELFSRLTWISNNSDTRLLAVLAAGLIALLNKYTDSRDIIVGMPIYKQEIEENFLNTVVALRCSLQEDMTFKDLLYRVKQTIDEAVKHQNYPIKTILYDLQFPFSENDFSLFDIILLLKNIQNPDYIRNIPVNIKFIFFRGLECIEISVLYNRFLYDRETVARIISHFSHLLQKAILNVDLKLSALEILSDEEKKKILEEFNNMQAGLKEHTGKTIHRLFEEQVEKTPDREAIVFIQQGQVPTILTYRQLDKKAQQVARTLNEKGIVAGHIVALLLEGSTHMAVAVLGVLKAGGAYLPIDIEAPGERKTFILKDSGVRLLLTGGAGEREADSTLFSSLKSIEQLDISHENISRHHTSRQPGDEIYRSDPGFQSNPSAPSDPAYIIYTSGSTGRPKGVIVEHRQPVNTLVCRKVEYLMGPGHTALQLFSYAFDGFITGFFTPIISGARVILLSKDTIQDISQIVDIIILFKVTHFISIPVLFQAILSGMTEEGAASLQVITLAGDKVQPKLLEMAAEKNKKMEIVNEYGVTEAAVMSTIYRHQERDRRVKIGRPIGNTLIYITKGSHGQYLAPINVFGEMCIAGTGVARGYLNNPQLTSEKFINFHHSKVFCTGDLARWLPDGNIEFSGRMDFQVKVRGFRIELGEIEKQLLTLKHIKECIVTAFQNDEGEKYLCAFIVSSQQFSISGLREHLGRRLPEYMIPAFFIFLEKMPLSPNGKVDRKQLPVPAVAPKVGEYEPPRDRLESQLLQIWADILRLDKDTVGIDANFFQLGGHSLTATLMSNRIYKDLNVKIPMLEIFKAPQVRHLAEYIRASSEERYNAILPAEKKVYYAVSSAQLRLYILQHMDPDAIVYNIPIMNRLDGELYKEKLEYTFRQLIVRHEPLRTSFALVDGHPVQPVHYGDIINDGVRIHMLQDI
ncbi:MAG: hypothetical protein QG657_5336 [Acidobacteriota bacterium]|nr:hypothetical protein [Acidobacteriota bacterium]